MPTIPLNTESSPEAVIELLFKLKVKDVMSTNIFTANPQTTMRDIQNSMKMHYITGLPITEGDTLVGIVSMDDIINAFDKNTIDEACESHMTRNLIVLQENMPLSLAVSYFNKYKFGRFPVLNKKNKLTGIVTTTDVIAALLVAMNKEVERLEIEAQQAQEALQIEDEKQRKKRSKILEKAKNLEAFPNRLIEFKTEPFNFETAGKASTEIKKILRSMAVDKALARRIGIASYELEINQVIHSKGGMMRYYISPENIVIEAIDRGPGIPDVDAALTEGFSTASEQVRTFGFGAGMGLPNTKRVSDHFHISSKPGKNTKVRVQFNLSQEPETE
ncbi:MAG TPA: CBS domain-containing protein [Treponemataceae bacterium]|nr:CBS domain-containing protein [Treponemataceae bacterium]